MSALTPLRTTALRRGIHHHHGTTTRPLQQRAATAATLHTTAARRQPYKDDQDRTSLKPQKHEYSQSGTDEQAAENPDAAFNPRKTSPEAARAAAARGSPRGSSNEKGGGNPLDVSPANRDFAESGRGKDEDRVPKASKGPSSRAGSPKKGGKVNPAAQETRTKQTKTNV
jgi:hypothetical protein